MPSEKKKAIPVSSWGWGRPNEPHPEVLAWKSFPWKLLFGMLAIVPALVVFVILGHGFTFYSFLGYILAGVICFLPILAVVVVTHAWILERNNSAPMDVDTYVDFKDAAFKKKWQGRKIPVETLQEAYFDGLVDFKRDLLECLYNRYKFSTMVLTWGHVSFFFKNLIPELLFHTRSQDTEQVRDHYDRGNDFYRSFLGPMMIYTSGIFKNMEESLEEAQLNKLNAVFDKIHLRKGESLLDIGCGWGTLAKHAAADRGADATGVTLAREQTKWAEKQIKEAKVQNKARILCMDYRDIPQATANKQFDKITCLEMAEHVGVRKFQSFMRQVYSMLKDDGIFFLQIAGLRRAFQYEDFAWGLFMGKYVFPGADASCPLGWVVTQVEQAGFEVRSSETIGVHYSATIKHWYDNWLSNRKSMQEKYPQWYRKWAWFLAWSVIIAEHGGSTCYQIVLHKNTRHFDRRVFLQDGVHEWNP